MAVIQSRSRESIAGMSAISTTNSGLRIVSQFLVTMLLESFSCGS